MVDTASLRDAYGALLDAAAAVVNPGDDQGPVAPPGEWGAEQILAHVALVNATTIIAVCAVSSGGPATYDNRASQDAWTIERLIARSGGGAGLCERIRDQADALCGLAGSTLSAAELDTPVPALLLSHGTALVDRPLPLRDLLTGLAEAEIPGHTRQLLALRP